MESRIQTQQALMKDLRRVRERLAGALQIPPLPGGKPTVHPDDWLQRVTDETHGFIQDLRELQQHIQRHELTPETRSEIADKLERRIGTLLALRHEAPAVMPLSTAAEDEAHLRDALIERILQEVARFLNEWDETLQDRPPDPTTACIRFAPDLTAETRALADHIHAHPGPLTNTSRTGATGGKGRLLSSLLGLEIELRVSTAAGW